MEEKLQSGSEHSLKEERLSEKEDNTEKDAAQRNTCSRFQESVNVKDVGDIQWQKTEGEVS